jgi:Fur family ferric uptake transcriptional regulator
VTEPRGYAQARASGIVAAMNADRRKSMDYEAVLRAAGLRITKPRRIILEILGESEGHPDAAQILERALARDSRISLATVYRTMKALEESGAIQRHAFAGGPARFEQANAGHHDHLIDIDTGEVIEFASPRIEALQEEIAARLGYEIIHHRLELYGRKRRD